MRWCGSMLSFNLNFRTFSSLINSAFVGERTLYVRNARYNDKKKKKVGTFIYALSLLYIFLYLHDEIF